MGAPGGPRPSEGRQLLPAASAVAGVWWVCLCAYLLLGLAEARHLVRLPYPLTRFQRVWGAGAQRASPYLSPSQPQHILPAAWPVAHLPPAPHATTCATLFVFYD